MTYSRINNEVVSFLDVDMSELRLPTISIFFNPTDFPNQYIARLFEFEHPTNIIAIGNTLEEIRAAIPPEFMRVERFVDDHESVVEVWI